MRRSWWVAFIALAVAAAACSGGGSGHDDGRLNVVTTVSPITNIVQNIGGTRVDVTGVVPEGTNSHTFEPAPSDARAFADADVVFINGLHLEDRKEHTSELQSLTNLVCRLLLEKKKKKINNTKYNKKQNKRKYCNVKKNK